MMRPALLLALLACLVGSGQANGSSPSLATGVPFGGIMMAFDTSSDPGLDSGSSAALSVRTQGSPVLSSGGVQGTALRLDGVDDAVMLDTGFTPISCDGIPNCEDRGDTFTLAFHVKLEPSQGAPGSKFLVCSRGQDDDSDTGIGATYPFVINSRQSNNPRGSHVNFGTWSGDVNHVNLEACAGGPSAQYDWAPGTAWSHIAIVSTPTTAKFFVDGVEKSPTGTTTCAGFKLGAHPMVGVSSIWSDAGGPLRLFDANGAWLPGGPRTRINANIDNLYFVTEALSASAIGSLYTFSAANSLLVTPAPTVSPVTFTGYLADTRCLGVVNGMDGVNASAEAPKHTVGCMLAPPCLASGYNLLEQVGNEYVVQYQLDDTANGLAVAKLRDLSAAGVVNNVQFTVTGMIGSANTGTHNGMALGRMMTGVTAFTAGTPGPTLPYPADGSGGTEGGAGGGEEGGEGGGEEGGAGSVSTTTDEDEDDNTGIIIACAIVGIFTACTFCVCIFFFCCRYDYVWFLRTAEGESSYLAVSKSRKTPPTEGWEVCTKDDDRLDGRASKKKSEPAPQVMLGDGKRDFVTVADAGDPMFNGTYVRTDELTQDEEDDREGKIKWVKEGATGEYMVMGGKEEKPEELAKPERKTVFDRENPIYVSEVAAPEGEADGYLEVAAK